MDKITIGERLRKLRAARSLTLLEVAEALNITPSALGNYENNNRQPSLSILKKISEYFGVTTDYLLGDNEAIYRITPDPDKPVSKEDMDAAINKFLDDNPDYMIKRLMPELSKEDLKLLLQCLYNITAIRNSQYKDCEITIDLKIDKS